MALAVSSVKYRSDLSIIKYYGYGANLMHMGRGSSIESNDQMFV